MSDPIFKGDIVRLADVAGDGSEDMTVDAINDDGTATCQLGGERGPATFPIDQLLFVRRYSIPVGNLIDKEA
jgi:hypothetical protein